MNVQPITTISKNFCGTKTTENGNVYHTTNTAALTGLAIGTILSASFLHGKIKALKTTAGKRKILEPYFRKEKVLPDRTKKNGAKKKSNPIARRYVNSAIGWGAIITGVTTLIGHMLDANTDLARSRMADGYIKPASYY